MSLKPVWIILAAPIDLAELAITHLSGQFPGLVAERYEFGFSITSEEGARLFLHDSNALDDFEPSERVQLAAWNLAGYAQSVESKDPHLTIELIARLSKLTDLAIDDDMGLLLRAKEFNALKPEQQVSFLIGNGI
ncbi:hypothetical protein [uncultured Tateyamaria sp.]|uniref:hypothetical protein n=1 Tax=uncultured Tateyamaria sp. TaxID=455651 RepID=UPI0026375606|nr:hypothetical protein [uncultured Tateyamaria sp.]